MNPIGISKSQKQGAKGAFMKELQVFNKDVIPVYTASTGIKLVIGRAPFPIK